MSRKPARSLRHKSNTLNLALFIGALIVLLILAGVAIKIFLLFQTSKFDGKHQFSIEISEPGDTRFVVFNPSDNSVHSLLLHGRVDSNPELSPGVPVDAHIKSESEIPSVDMLVKDLIFHGKELTASTTIIDVINLFIFSHTANNDKVVALESQASADATSQDVVFSKIFSDPAIYKEGESIAVVNGSGISGLGTKVSRLITNMGGNVISVTTAIQNSPHSSIEYVGNNSYTLTRLSQVFHMPTIHLLVPTISDITVTLGEDFHQ